MSHNIGVVFDRISGNIKRIINPDYDWELQIHKVKQDEFMLRVNKSKFGISTELDAMTLAQVYKVTESLKP